MLIVELITRDKPPLERSVLMQTDTCREYLRGKFSGSEVGPIPQKLIDVAALCLVSNPQERPSIEALLLLL